MDIRATRKELGLTQVELGQKIGVTQAAIAKWEAGSRPLPDWARISIERVVEDHKRAA